MTSYHIPLISVFKMTFMMTFRMVFMMTYKKGRVFRRGTSRRTCMRTFRAPVLKLIFRSMSGPGQVQVQVHVRSRSMWGPGPGQVQVRSRSDLVLFKFLRAWLWSRTTYYKTIKVFFLLLISRFLYWLKTPRGEVRILDHTDGMRVSRLQHVTNLLILVPSNVILQDCVNSIRDASCLRASFNMSEEWVNSNTNQKVHQIIPNKRTWLSILVALNNCNAVGSLALAITQVPTL